MFFKTKSFSFKEVDQLSHEYKKFKLVDQDKNLPKT